MTSKTTSLTKGAGKLERFPDYPPREDMQNWLYLYETSVLTSLAIHFADEPNVTVASEVVGPSLPVRDDARIPDLLVVRDGDRALMEEQRGYAIDSQGKAPDFVLEVASRSTGRVDYTDKRLDYERFGILEYWRFDSSGGEYHDAALAGDLLVDGMYRPIEIETLQEGMLRGYSDALGLYVCWEDGRLRFFDPRTEGYLSTHDEAEARAEEERVSRMAAQARAGTAEARAGTAEARAEEEQAARMAAQAHAEEERASRVAAESRLVELEAELHARRIGAFPRVHRQPDTFLRPQNYPLKVDARKYRILLQWRQATERRTATLTPSVGE